MALILTDPRFWIALAVLAVLLAALALLARLRWRPAYLLRLVLLAALLPALLPTLEPEQTSRLPSREVLLLDESGSVAFDRVAANRTLARAWMAGRANRVVVPFGAQASPLPGADAGWPKVDTRASDLEGALKTAGHLLEGISGRVILASDGLAAAPDAVTAAAARLAAAGQRLDVLPLASVPAGADLAVEGVSVPAGLWAGLPFAAAVRLRVPRAAQVSLQAQVDGQPVREWAENLPAGSVTLTVPLQAHAEGIITVAVQARLAGDTRPENDTAYAAVQVFPTPSALLVTEEPQAAARFALLLNSTGVQVRIATPEELPTNMTDLRQVQIILLDNLLIDSLSGEQLSALKIFVNQLGRGLVILGGRSAYTLGGYDNSVLEAVLPVKMQPPERQKRAPVTFVLMVDVSASMGYSTVPDQPRPIDLAREAAMRVIESMQPDDTLGIASYSDEVSWDLPLGRVGDGMNLRLATDTASRLNPLFGTQMYRALLQVVKKLGTGDGKQKRYLLLLSDGKSADGSLLEFRNLTKLAAENGLTVSTIALGQEPDRALMAAIAAAGHGRYYDVPDVRMLPRVMVNETRAAKSENVQEGQTGVKAGGEHPVLNGVDLAGFPALSGYNALRSRAEEGAEDILLSASFGDPLLSVWQSGLGRVAAWMSDAGGEWSGGMLDWPDAGKLWAQLLRYTLPAPGLEISSAAADVEDTRLVIRAQLRAENGTAVSFAQPVAQIAGADGQVRAYPLTETAAGDYRAELERPAPGAYRAVVQWQEGDTAHEIPLPFAVIPGREDLPADPEEGQAALKVWAQQGGGKVIALTDLNAGSAETPATGLLPKTSMGWLLPAALVGWVLEIAIRRRWLPWR